MDEKVITPLQRTLDLPHETASGLAVQRLMAQAALPAGDWKTAALDRLMKVMSHNNGLYGRLHAEMAMARSYPAISYARG
jgi:hypothetical protein